MVVPVKKAPVYLVFGKDPFLKEEFLNGLKKELFPSGPGPDYEEFEPRSPWSRAADFLGTAPFLADKRLAVIRDAESLPPAAQAAALEYCRKPSPRGVAVFIAEDAVPQKNAFLRSLAAAAQGVNCQPPADPERPGWIARRAEVRGLRIDGRTALLLAERFAGLGGACLAIEQLAVAVHPRTSVAFAEAEKLVGGSLQAGVFDLTDAIAEKNAGRAAETLEALFREGTKGVEILGILAAQWDRLLRTAILRDEGLAPAEIAARLGVHAYYATRLLSQAGRTGTPVMKRRLAELLECDEAVKTGRLGERLAVERFVLGAMLERS
ncbi:MAG: DNA polymerase III subunit delta [Omnitrophica bacterium RIFCSPHIGHO2_02_FULL_63_14]|nr:MAG: DNA polymerase III subunit delta [Omnitrophica bacterium RIFCSPHIGHO2_02_FULL_63_14]